MATSEPASISLHLKPSPSSPSTSSPSPLPTLLQTPSGLAILELQGTFNTPDPDDPDSPSSTTPTNQPGVGVDLGTLSFPDYNPDDVTGSTGWMKRVYMFVGAHQRLLGEVKKLGKPLAVVRRRGGGVGEGGEEGEGGPEDLEVVEIVKYKIVFSQRPEPVTTLLVEE